MSCCSKNKGLSSKTVAQLRTELNRLSDIFQTTDVMACIMESSSGSAIFRHNFEASNEKHFMELVIGVKQAAGQLGETVGQMDCPSLHIKGAHTIFSSYEFGKQYVLIVVAKAMAPLQVDSFDTTAADTRVFPVIENVQKILASTG